MRICKGGTKDGLRQNSNDAIHVGYYLTRFRALQGVPAECRSAERRSKRFFWVFRRPETLADTNWPGRSRLRQFSRSLCLRCDGGGRRGRATNCGLALMVVGMR